MRTAKAVLRSQTSRGFRLHRSGFLRDRGALRSGISVEMPLVEVTGKSVTHRAKCPPRVTRRGTVRSRLRR